MADIQAFLFHTVLADTVNDFLGCWMQNLLSSFLSYIINIGGGWAGDGREILVWSKTDKLDFFRARQS